MAVNMRYIVDDVEKAIEFYRDMLGFEVEMHPGPGFAALRLEELRLLINAPGAGGAGVAGGDPEPGGWLRFQPEIDALDTLVMSRRDAGAAFRGDIVDGQGGRQIIVEDPSGNPIELFEPKASR